MRRILIILVILGAIGFWQYSGRYGSTPPFQSANESVVTGSVAEMQRIKLGGVDQSVTIRGLNADAPILIWLHGGPGQDATGMLRKYNSELEHFSFNMKHIR
jgi:proline iminopeptidase